MNQLTRSLGLQSATLLVVSAMVGTGVFKKVAPMAAELQSPTLVLACWAVAGLVSLAGALTNAEMAGLFPQAGGEYGYYQHVYGRFFAFLYGWGSFMVMKTATIAAQAYVFGQSLVGLFGLEESEVGLAVKGAATGLIVVLSFLNYRGLALAEGITRVLTVLMFVAMGAIIVLGLQSQSGSWANLTTPDLSAVPTGQNLLNALVLASLGAFWGYEGWNYIGYMGEEVRNPQRNLPLALGIGTALVIGLYMLLNAVYLYALPINSLAQINSSPDQIAAVEVVRQGAGALGVLFVSGLIVVTTFNATNATVLMSARLFYAMARDGLFFRSAAQIHPRYQTPWVAVVLQGIWAVGLVWSGSFDQLTDRLIFAAFIFYGATAVGVIWLRFRFPNAERPFRVPGYPVVPLLFGGFCLFLVAITLINQPEQALTGLALIATGVPFYWFWTKEN